MQKRNRRDFPRKKNTKKVPNFPQTDNDNQNIPGTIININTNGEKEKEENLGSF